MPLIQTEHTRSLFFASFELDRFETSKCGKIGFVGTNDDRVRFNGARHRTQRGYAGRESYLDGTIPMAARELREPAASQLVSALADSDERVKQYLEAGDESGDALRYVFGELLKSRSVARRIATLIEG